MHCQHYCAKSPNCLVINVWPVNSSETTSLWLYAIINELRYWLLRTETEQQVQTLGKRAGSARSVFDVVYRRPVIAAAELKEELEVSRSTVHGLIKELIRLGIITEITGQMRDRLYSFSRYYSLFLGD